MMGHRQVEQAALFYEFSLEKHIPSDYLLRSADRFVDLQEIRQDLAPFYSSIGRPSIDPELMIRMLLIGYCFGIRSERRLCDEVHLNGLPMVLPARSGGGGAGSFDILQEQAWPLPAERSLPSRVRERVAPLHRGATGRW